MTSQCLLQLKVTNHSSEPLRDFVFKMNTNHYGFTVDEGIPQGFMVGPGATAETSILCSPIQANAQGPEPTKPPILIQAGLLSSLDLFYFEVPVLAQVLFAESPQSGSMSANYIFDNWNSKNHPAGWSYEQPKMSTACNNPTNLQNRLKRNNVHFLRQSQTNMGVPCFYVFAEIINSQDVVCCEIAINVQAGNKVTLKAWSEQSKNVPLVIQAISFVL